MLVTELLKIKFFKDSTMSSIAQHTQILIKDCDFQAKYSLSHTQTDLMAYMVNVPYWADCVAGYYIITTSKILSDLPFIGEKTFQASFKILKEKGLIESKIIEVKDWKGKPKLRGIRLTSRGKLYKSNMILPSQDKKIRELEKALNEAIEELAVSKKKEKISEPPKVETQPTPQPPKKEKIDEFIKDMSRHFGLNSKPLCNFVPTYKKETTFYINSYNKLSVITPENSFKQLTNPKTIHEFWQWLYLNPQRVGNKIDFSKAPTQQELNDRFINRTIKIGGEKKRILAFVQEQNGIKVKVKNEDGSERFLINLNTKKEMIFELEYCQEVLFRVLV